MEYYNGIPMFKELPEGWVAKEVPMVGNGYVFIWNKKSMVERKYRHGVMTQEDYDKSINNKTK